MDREGFAKVPRWYRESKLFFLTKVLAYPSYHTMAGIIRPMPEIQDCNLSCCECFAKVPNELREVRVVRWFVAHAS